MTDKSKKKNDPIEKYFNKSLSKSIKKNTGAMIISELND